MGEDSFLLTDADLKRQRRRVFTLQVDGATYYVKKLRTRTFHLGHGMQRLVYWMTHNPLLAPTAFTDGKTSLAYEVAKLDHLKSAGFPVPEVVYREPHYFVMRDVGKPLHKVIRKERDRAEAYVRGAVEVLARLHREGFAHGGAQLRNFTVRNGETHVIDFEENMEATDLHSMQLRDLLLFLAYLERESLRLSYDRLLGAYESKRGSAFRASLGRVVHGWRFLKAFERGPFRRMAMQDFQALCRMVRKLETVVER